MAAIHTYAGFVTAVVVSRVAAAFFAAVSALGFLWFLGSHEPMTIAYFIATLVALVIFAAYPRRTLTFFPIRMFVLAIAIIAALTTLPQMYRDITEVGGAYYTAVGLRVLECVVFAVMAFEVLV